MKIKSPLQTLCVATAILCALPHFATVAAAPNVVDEIEMVRSALKADRKVVIAEAMDFTPVESAAFWPIYREYMAEWEKVVDARIKLVLEYADAYPNVPDARAKQMLKDYTALDEKAVSVRNKYLKKVAKVLPSDKALRYAQLENRFDLVVRIQMAAQIPLVPKAKTR